MRVSVALCTLNGVKYLSEQLSSILVQDRLPDEVVVSDDGSDDGTMELLEGFARDAPMPVRLLRNEARVGVTANFEQAIAACTGDVVLLCDQDDVWSPARVSTLVGVFDREPRVAMAFSNAFLIDRDGRRLRPRLWDVIDLGRTQQARFRSDPFGFVLARSAVTGCTLAIRSSHLGLLLPFPAEREESSAPVLHDWWIALALAAAAGSGRLAMVDEPLVSYRLHPEQRIGLPELSLRRSLPGWVLRFGNARVPLREQRRRLELLAEVLADLEARLEVEARDQVRGASAHLAARAGLAGPRLGRVRVVSQELRAGRYHEFGRGVPSAFADLVRVAG
jgi:hypothetical protein